MNNSLFSGLSQEQYGDQFRSHYLEIYKTYVEGANAISDRRQKANSFFLSINTAITGTISYLQATSENESGLLFYLLTSVLGILISYMWYRLVLSYKQINSGKFKVIHQIERNLPISPYNAEWEMLGKGNDPKRYFPFTQVEALVPWAFLGLYAVILIKISLILYIN